MVLFLGRTKLRACCLSGFVHCAVACWPARLRAKKWRTFFAAVYMTSSQQALAPRSSTTLDAVHDILGTLVARYRTDEVLTCLRQIPARDPVFRPMPDWVSRELSDAYRTKGIKELYSHQ